MTPEQCVTLLTSATNEKEFITLFDQHKHNLRHSLYSTPAIYFNETMDVLRYAVANDWTRGVTKINNWSDRKNPEPDLWVEALVGAKSFEMVDALFGRSSIPTYNGWMDRFMANQSPEMFKHGMDYLKKRFCLHVSSMMFCVARQNLDKHLQTLLPELNEDELTYGLMIACRYDSRKVIDLLYTPERFMAGRDLELRDQKTLGVGWAYGDGKEIEQALGDVGQASKKMKKL